jgi:TatA/E family protein of Tat protein translocase
MFGVGIPELMVIFLVALVILGPKQLPEVAKFLGKALGEFRKATDDISAEFNNAKSMLEEEVRQAERAAQEEKARAAQGEKLPPSSTPPTEPAADPVLTPPEFTVAQTKKEPPTGEPS